MLLYCIYPSSGMQQFPGQGKHHFLPGKFRKIQPWALWLGIPFFVCVMLCLFTCMKKPFWSCRAPIKWSSPVLPPVKEAASMLHSCPVRRDAQPSQEGVLCAEVTSMVSFSGTGFEQLLCSAVQVRSGQDEEPWSHSAWVASAPASWGRARNSHNPMCALLKCLVAVGLCESLNATRVDAEVQLPMSSATVVSGTETPFAL